jgi:hypothetical protein
LTADNSDAALARRCIPLLNFLALPRTEREIADWATGRCIGKGRLRCMLRFLESQPNGGAFQGSAFSERPTSALWRRYP